MTTLIIMYAVGYGITTISSERNIKTGNRILSSPVRKHEVLIAKLAGGVFATSLQILTVLIVSKYIIGAYWGNHIGTILLIFLSQVIMIISLGVGISFLIKNEAAASSLTSTAIPFLVFLGGGYVPLEQFGSKALLTVAKISPVRWTNDSILEAIFANSTSKAGTAIAINLAIAATFIIIASILYRREEA
jgi:ABC-2 type transport system permease protein